MATRCVLWATCAGLLIGGTGCSLSRPRPVTFHVRDGDTGRPIEGASVRADYIAMLDFGVLFASIGPREGKTDRDGKLTLILDPYKGSFNLSVSADGYPGGNRWAGLLKGAYLAPTTWLSFRDDYRIDLFRNLDPVKADITLPDDYRGLVVVRFVNESRMPAVPGQREFSYTASPKGVVHVPETRLFWAGCALDNIRARYRDGAAFHTFTRWEDGSRLYEDTVALRLITPDWESHTWVYVLGTAADEQAVKVSLKPVDDAIDPKLLKRLVDSRN